MSDTSVRINVRKASFKLINANFSFEDGSSDRKTFNYPVAPLVSACYDKFEEHLIIVRVVLFVAKTGQKVDLYTDEPRFINGVLFLNCSYDSTEEPIYNEFEIWSMEYHCDVYGAFVGALSVTLDNKDPKTSRGTITSVQRQ